MDRASQCGESTLDGYVLLGSNSKLGHADLETVRNRWSLVQMLQCSLVQISFARTGVGATPYFRGCLEAGGELVSGNF